MNLALTKRFFSFTAQATSGKSKSVIAHPIVWLSLFSVIAGLSDVFLLYVINHLFSNFEDKSILLGDFHVSQQLFLCIGILSVVLNLGLRSLQVLLINTYVENFTTKLSFILFSKSINKLSKCNDKKDLKNSYQALLSPDLNLASGVIYELITFFSSVATFVPIVIYTAHVDLPLFGIIAFPVSMLFFFARKRLAMILRTYGKSRAIALANRINVIDSALSCNSSVEAQLFVSEFNTQDRSYRDSSKMLKVIPSIISQSLGSIVMAWVLALLLIINLLPGIAHLISLSPDKVLIILISLTRLLPLLQSSLTSFNNLQGKEENIRRISNALSFDLAEL